MMKTVEALVSEWTVEEREEFRDLIQECQEREKRLIKNTKACKESLFQLTESLISLVSSSSDIRKRTEKLADDLFGMYLQLYRNRIPPS
jgi:chromosome segregation ATPase